MTTEMAWVITSTLILLVVVVVAIPLTLVLRRRRKLREANPITEARQPKPEANEPDRADSTVAEVATTEQDDAPAIEISTADIDDESDATSPAENDTTPVNLSTDEEVDITDTSIEHAKEPALVAEAFDIGRASNVIRITIDDHAQKHAPEPRTRAHHHHH